MVIVLLLAVAGLLVTQIGGEAIRSASLTYEIGGLRLTSDTLLPGVPVTVTVNTELLGRGQSSVLLLRMPTGSMTMGDVELDGLGKGTFRVTVPCESGEQTPRLQGKEMVVRLVLVDHATQAVLAQSDQLKLLPSGPDCLFAQ